MNRRLIRTFAILISASLIAVDPARAVSLCPNIRVRAAIKSFHPCDFESQALSPRPGAQRPGVKSGESPDPASIAQSNLTATLKVARRSWAHVTLGVVFALFLRDDFDPVTGLSSQNAAQALNVDSEPTLFVRLRDLEAVGLLKQERRRIPGRRGAGRAFFLLDDRVTKALSSGRLDRESLMRLPVLKETSAYYGDRLRAWQKDTDDLLRGEYVAGASEESASIKPGSGSPAVSKPGRNGLTDAQLVEFVKNASEIDFLRLRRFKILTIRALLEARGKRNKFADEPTLRAIVDCVKPAGARDELLKGLRNAKEGRFARTNPEMAALVLRKLNTANLATLRRWLEAVYRRQDIKPLEGMEQRVSVRMSSFYEYRLSSEGGERAPITSLLDLVDQRVFSDYEIVGLADLFAEGEATIESLRSDDDAWLPPELIKRLEARGQSILERQTLELLCQATSAQLADWVVEALIPREGQSSHNISELLLTSVAKFGMYRPQKRGNPDMLSSVVRKLSLILSQRLVDILRRDAEASPVASSTATSGKQAQSA